MNSNIKQPFKPGLQSAAVQSGNEAVIEFQKKLMRRHALHSCLNCEYWTKDDKGNVLGCGLHKAFPPPEVVVYSCRDWEGDIPF